MQPCTSNNNSMEMCNGDNRSMGMIRMQEWLINFMEWLKNRHKNDRTVRKTTENQWQIPQVRELVKPNNKLEVRPKSYNFLITTTIFCYMSPTTFCFK